MTAARSSTVGIPLLLLALVCCSGTTSTSGDGGEPGPGVCGDKVSGTPTGRPVAAQCSASSIPPPAGDAGPMTCMTDTDCGAGTVYRWCRGGKCEADQCSGDADCATGQACACANEQVGNAEHTNACVTSQCRLDSDCPGGQACSPTTRDLCGGGGPFFACHSSADTCRVDADCCSSAPACRYQPSVGHWQCAGVCTING